MQAEQPCDFVFKKCLHLLTLRSMRAFISLFPRINTDLSAGRCHTVDEPFPGVTNGSKKRKSWSHGVSFSRLLSGLRHKEKHAYCCARSGRPWGCLGLCPSWSRPLIFRHPSFFLHVLCFVVRISRVPARCIRTIRVSSPLSRMRLAHYQIKVLLDVLDKILYPSD